MCNTLECQVEGFLSELNLWFSGNLRFDEKIPWTNLGIGTAYPKLCVPSRPRVESQGVKGRKRETRAPGIDQNSTIQLSHVLQDSAKT